MKSSSKKFFVIGILVLLLVTIPLTLYFVKQQQDLRSKAAPSSTLSLVAAEPSLPVGETFSVDVMLDPGNNIPSFVKFTVNYDPNKVEITQITPDPQNITSTLSGPTIASDSATVDLGISKALTGYDPNVDFTQPFRVATIKLLAIEKTDTPTVLSFSFPGQTEVYSLAAEDSPGENVLQNTTPVSLTVVDASDGGNEPTATPTPQTQPTASPTPTATIRPTNTPVATASPTLAANTNPVCTSLTATPASGSAPLVVQLAASGNDPDGTITKVTFNFGDGQVVDVTEGVGTKSATVQQSHTFATANTFSVTSAFTDNRGGVSAACTQTVTVQPADTDNGSLPQPSPTEVVVQPTTPPPIDAPGSFGTILGISGALVLTIIGALVFFVL